MSKIQKIVEQDIGDSDDVRKILSAYNGLDSLAPFEYTAFGPNDGDDDEMGVKAEVMTGSRLKSASTNKTQGEWLYKLACFAARECPSMLNIVELGTAAGISGMYLLAGASEESEKLKLFTFEGSPELAEVATRNLSKITSSKETGKCDFEIVLGNFDEVVEQFFSSFPEKVGLALIDGNHREDATLAYHRILRQVMSPCGIIVHDDINWSKGMRKAWYEIKQLEGAGRTVELYLGNQATRGIVFLDENPEGESAKFHLDSPLERIARQLKRALLG
ncbi:class I SAM-dependent methyltransferase [Pseudomonadales bacterium]|nr:class I SAM-dependent methyltransferase [Pseudomonadales bacterium]MDB2543099.1 class I SAM-dependent methyltransferase [Pseudomonadales bacterium]